MKVGIKFRLAIFITSLLIFVIMLFSFITLHGIKNYQKAKDESILLNQKNLFEQYLATELNSSQYFDMKSQSDLHLNSANMFNKPWLNSIPANIYDINGKLIYAIENGSKEQQEMDDGDMLKYCMKGKIAYFEKNNYIYYYSPLKYNGKTVAILRLRYSVKENNDFYNNMKFMIIVMGAILMVVGSVMGMIYFIPLTRDIQKITYSVKNIQNGDFDNIKGAKRKDEIGILSEGIAYMSSTIKSNIMELENEKQSLSKAVLKLEAMGKQQKEFIGNVTHEFKTPLTSIKASADIMLMYEYDPDFFKETLQNMSKECERLAVIIDDVLTLSSLEKYDFEIKKEAVKLKPLIEQIASRMLAKIKKNDINFKSELEDLEIIGDEEGVRHILINLIDNAIKYNKPKGEIKVSTYKKADKVYIQVEDTGIGIPEKHLNKIFEPFYRVKADRSRKTGGTGIGLAFVKKMVESQNGKIYVESKEDVGSIFKLVFPLYIS